MITGLYSAIGDSIPILCITGQAPTAVIHKEDFQAVDIASIAAPVTKAATTVLEAAQVPGVFQQAFHLMRSGRPGPVLIDLPIDVQLTEIEFDPETYQPLPVYRPLASRAQIDKALAMLTAARAPADRGRRRRDQRRRRRTAGGVRRADRRAGGADADGLGRHRRRPRAERRAWSASRPRTATATPRSWSRTSCSASATAGPTATPAGSTSTPRAAPSCTSTSSRPRSARSSPPTTASPPTPRPRWSCSSPRPGS